MMSTPRFRRRLRLGSARGGSAAPAASAALGSTLPKSWGRSRGRQGREAATHAVGEPAELMPSSYGILSSLQEGRGLI